MHCWGLRDPWRLSKQMLHTCALGQLALLHVPTCHSSHMGLPLRLCV